MNDPLMPAMLLTPRARPRWSGGEGVGQDGGGIGDQERCADALDDPADDQPIRADRSGERIDGQHQRRRGVDDKPEVVHLHPAEHVAEPAETDDQHTADDQEAEDHPEQIERVARLKRIQADAAKDVGHRDQHDRRVDRRQHHADRGVGQRQPLVARRDLGPTMGRAAGGRRGRRRRGRDVGRWLMRIEAVVHLSDRTCLFERRCLSARAAAKRPKPRYLGAPLDPARRSARPHRRDKGQPRDHPIAHPCR